MRAADGLLRLRHGTAGVVGRRTAAPFCEALVTQVLRPRPHVEQAVRSPHTEQRARQKQKVGLPHSVLCVVLAQRNLLVRLEGPLARPAAAKCAAGGAGLARGEGKTCRTNEHRTESSTLLLAEIRMDTFSSSLTL